MPDYKSLILKKLKGRRKFKPDDLMWVVCILEDYKQDIEEGDDPESYVFGKFKTRRDEDRYTKVMLSTLADLYCAVRVDGCLWKKWHVHRCLRTLLES